MAEKVGVRKGRREGSERWGFVIEDEEEEGLGRGSGLYEMLLHEIEISVPSVIRMKDFKLSVCARASRELQPGAETFYNISLHEALKRSGVQPVY